ncbi:class I adenylate-forming enzyme family protein [Roseovarius salinarum]|uniref:class I adenylate-forming enzyme family protein n=1 Tax=Roseovarius salinarum TaxID=1981892 RepID=UPI000C344EAB|nr:AMP-binding protein [Roseovarius salinarum]
MNIAQWLARVAAVSPRRPAVFLGRERACDYAGLHGRAARLAGWLSAQGVAPGDRVAIFMTNVPDYLTALFGIWYAGGAAVPINAKLHGREAAWIIGDAGAAVTLASPEQAAALRAAAATGRLVETDGADWAVAMDHAPSDGPAARAPGDLAWLFYTSGTTGTPKGVMITHRMLQGMTLSYLSDVDTVTAGDATLYAAPMSHGAGLYSLPHVLMGARHVCPPSGGFDPAEILDLARRHERLHMFAAPTMVNRLTAHARDAGETGAGLRTIVYGGGPMYLADIEAAVDRFGPVFVQIFGQGECPMCITALSRHDVADRTHPRWRERLGSVGRAQSLVEVAIGDEAGRVLPPGETGEIMVRGDPVMPGYWQNPQATRKALRDGWLMTGDVGRIDADGYVTLHDRSKDVIISGGTNVYPREVEEALLSHPSVAEVSVVGRPDAEWGEVVVAFVVPASGSKLDEAALDAHCLDRIARFKRPKAYVALGALPKNNYGKVLKTELRKILEGANG